MQETQKKVLSSYTMTEKDHIGLRKATVELLNNLSNCTVALVRAENVLTATH